MQRTVVVPVWLVNPAVFFAAAAAIILLLPQASSLAQVGVPKPALNEQAVAAADGLIRSR